MNCKFKAVLMLAVMYGLGVASALVWQACQDHRPFARHSAFAEHRILKLKKQLNLTPDQEQAMRRIFETAHERATQINEEVSWDLAEIHHDSVVAIRKILTPDQARDFEKLHSQYPLHHQPMSDEEMDVSTRPVRARP